MENNRPSSEFIQRCKEDFKHRLDGAIRVHCSRVENRQNVLILDGVLSNFMISLVNIEFNEENSEYTVSALPTAEITVTGLGRFTKALVGGGAGGAAAGLVGGGGAGAGIGAMIGIVGGPIGVAIGVGIGAGAGAAMGTAAGALPGMGFAGYVVQRIGRDIRVNWENICENFPGQMENDINTRKLKVTLQLDASSQ